MANALTKDDEPCDPDDRLLEAIDSFEAARDARLKPDPQAYLALYPDVADRLARYFTNQEDLIRLLAPPEADDAAAEAFPEVPGYHLLEQIAPGGMGIVYRAWQRSPGRMVALKVIRPDRLEGVSPRQRRRALERFRTEAQAAAQLEHDHIVGVLEVGEAGGRPYFSMRYVEGTSLHGLLKEGPLDCRRAAAYLEQVARAVYEAHRHGILHRDLKPSNILVEGKTDRPLVADFGLAKLQRASPEQTKTVEVVGTPPYMSPEQACNPARVTVVSDVYGLGATLYALLTGRPPFQGTTDAETHRLILEAEPPSLRGLNPQVDRDLETICLKCLEKEPDRRYRSAEALADDLGHWLQGEPIAARRTGLVERAMKWARRNPAWATAGVLAAALLVAAFAVPLLFAYREHQNAVQLGKALRETKYQLAMNQLDEGLSFLGEKGDGGLGMLKLAAGLKTAPPDADDLARAIRINLDSWYGRLSSLRACYGQPAEVLAVTFRPDGKVALTGGADGVVRFWDTASGKQLSLRLDHGSEVCAVAYHPSGKLVLTGGAGGARLWRVEAAESSSLPLAHGGKVCAVAFSKDGKVALTGGEDHTARFWDVDTGEPLGRPLVHKSKVLTVAFHPDGKVAVTGNGDGNVRFWEVDTGKPTGPLIEHENQVYSLAFSPDGKTLVTGGADLTARLWDVGSGEHQRSLPHRGRVQAVAFSPDGRFVLTGGTDKTARLWDAATGKPLGQPLPHRDEVRAVAFSPDGRFVLTGGADKTARYWEAASGKENGILFHHPMEVRTLTFDQDGARVLTGCGDGQVRLWNPVTPVKPLLSVKHQKKINCVAMSPDGRRFLTGAYNDPARLWDAANGQPIGQPLRNDGWVIGTTFSPDSRTAVTAGQKGIVRLWQADMGGELGEPLTHLQPIYAMALGDDGRTLVTGCHDNAAWLWDVMTRTKRHALPHRGPVLAVALGPGSRWVLTGSVDRTARLWSVENAEPLGAPLGHDGEVRVVAIGRRGELLLTAGDDGTARVWEAGSGKPHCRPMRHADKVWAAVLAPDEKTVLTGSWDHTARFWDTATGRPLGPALEFGGQVRAVAICPHGRRAAVGSDDGRVLLCDVPAQREGTVDSLVLWAKVIAGMEMDDSGGARVADAETWWNWSQQLAEIGAPLPRAAPGGGNGRE
jgi:WD40 repeat protein/predicted Ser/Thr protein kinase